MTNSTFIRERDNALFSLDENKIRAFCRKYNRRVSDDPLEFWATVYKSAILLENCPPDVRKKAEDWLENHGFIKKIRRTEKRSSQRYPRHIFEHVILPSEFYLYGRDLVEKVVAGDRWYISHLYNNIVNEKKPVKPYGPESFAVTKREYDTDSDVITIVRITLPKPIDTTECRYIYLCASKDGSRQMYFTSELSAAATYFLCAWTKKHTHLLLNMDPAQPNEYDYVAQLFDELAGFEPQEAAAI